MSLRGLRSIGAEGILDDSDLPQLGASVTRVLCLMADGRWCRAEEIEAAAGWKGQPARGGLRRMRELRRYGLTVERRKVEGLKRVFEYRLFVPRPEAPHPPNGSLF